MKTETQATITDLYDVPDNGKAELVDEEIVLMSPTGGLPGYAGDEIYVSLRSYARHIGRGVAVSDNKAFIVDLPNRKSFSPDAGFYVGKMSANFYKGAPLLAVEVRSVGDYGPTAERKIAAKCADYFAAGTQVVWDVDVLKEEVVRVYRKGSAGGPTIYGRGEIAEAEPAVPGWSMPVDDMFYPETDNKEE